MNTDGEFSDPSERERAEGPELEPDATRHYEIERIPEPEPGPGPAAEPTEIVEVIIPSEPPHLPVPRPPVGVVVRRRRLALLYALIALLLVVLGGMAYAMISNNHKQLAAVDSTSSATTSAQASATDTGSDGADDPSSSASASGDPAASGSASPGASGSDDSSATSTDAAGAGDPSPGFTPPYGTEYLPSPVDGDGNVYTQQDVHISDIDYANSSTFYCPTSGLIDWDVAGYSTFAAEYGIPDDAQSATGITNTITFTDQNGKSLDVATASIGQPLKISFSVSGVDRLIMSCARQGSNNSTNNVVALGNASLSTS